MKKEVVDELNWLMKGKDDPLHVVSNYVYLLEKCYQVGEEVPEEAKDLFRESINRLGRAWNLVKAIKDLP
jgi:hypothetical protein